MNKNKFLHAIAVILTVAGLLSMLAVSAFAASGWTAENGALYYYLSDGSKATGTQTIDDAEYYFLSDGRLSGDDLLVSTPQGMYWVKGASLTTGFRAEADELYYFDANGLRVENGEAASLAVVDGIVQGNGLYVRNGTVRYYLADNKVLFSVTDSDAQLVLTADNTSAGNQTEVTLELKNNPGIADMQVELQFDKAKLTHTFTYNENLLGGFSEEETANGILLSWSTVADCKNDGKLVTLYFSVADEQGAQHLSAVCTSAASADGKEKPVKPAAAAIAIACAHNFEEYIFNNDATCTSDGTKTAVCTVCGISDTVKAPNSQLPHTGGNASCMAKAVCAVCGSPYGSYDTNVHLHKVRQARQEPTCYVNGWTDYEVCTDCKKELGKTVLYATNHKNTIIIPATLPTCTKDGHSQYEYCPDCNRAKGFEIVPATGHQNTATVPALAPTCTEDGHEAYTVCTDCNAALDKVTIPAIRHSNRVPVDGKPATCEEDGYTDYYYCPDCNSDFGKTEIEKIAHKNQYTVPAKAKTCTEDGHNEYVHCPDCNADFGKEVDKAEGHPSTTAITAVAPTCTKPGYEAYEVCLVCLQDIGKVDLPATGHSNFTYFDALAPTCTEDGHSAYRVCGVCNEEIGKTVRAALNHKNSYKVGAKEPTCTEDGHTDYTYCPDCDMSVGKQTYPAKNHGNKVFCQGLAPTCSTDGYSAYFHCPDCGEDIGREPIAALQHKNATAFPEQPATCTQPGVKEHILCPDCGLTIGKVEIPALNHQNKYTVSAIEPTCKENGQTSYTYCPDCGLEEGKETIPPTGHTFTIWIAEQPAGFEKEGVEARWCSICQEIERRPIKPLTIADGKVYQCGDIDKNNVLTAEDARSALRFAVGLDTPTDLQRELADYDGNGEITSADARLLLRASVGMTEITADLCFVTPSGYFERLKNEEE